MRDIKLQLQNWSRRSLAVSLGVTVIGLGACDGLLEVDLPSQLTDQALVDPSGADFQVNSVIAHFECGYSSFAYFVGGYEDTVDPQAAVYYAGGAHNFDIYPPGGTCDQTAQHSSFYTQFLVSRAMSYDIYDRLNGDDAWTAAQVPTKERLSAVAAIYSAANLEFFGELFCETAIDAGPLMTANETLALANTWVGTALTHIGGIGDFEMPHDITPEVGGATAMAHALRARILWAQGDLAGAAQAGAMVPQGFEAHVTRGGGLQRRNKVYQQGLQTRYATIPDVNDWWEGDPNPATGLEWPAVIPFTGYLNLGVLPDGRAVRDDGLPIRTAGDYRTPVEDSAILDPRLPMEFSTAIQGGGQGFVPTKYTSESDPIPFISWEEIWLIRAEAAGGATAIALVNDIRDAHGLPRVTYADPNNAQQIRYMIIEEKRRSLWFTGRYIATKIQNTDILWFPRAQGWSPSQGVEYMGGVRMLMPNSEFELNENLTREDRATGCEPAQRPVRFE